MEGVVASLRHRLRHRGAENPHANIINIAFETEPILSIKKEPARTRCKNQKNFNVGKLNIKFSITSCNSSNSANNLRTSTTSRSRKSSCQSQSPQNFQIDKPNADTTHTSSPISFSSMPSINPCFATFVTARCNSLQRAPYWPKINLHILWRSHQKIEQILLGRKQLQNNSRFSYLWTNSEVIEERHLHPTGALPSLRRVKMRFQSKNK